MSIHSEKDLVERLSNGDIHAFKILFANYHKKLYTFAFHLLHSREDAEEVVHDVFVKIWENKAGLKSDSSFHGYICTIAKNLIYNLLRKKSYENRYIRKMEKLLPGFHNETEDDIMSADLEHLYKEAIEKLPPRRKLIYNLSRDKGMSYQDISVQLHISENTVKEQMSQALKFLKEYLAFHKVTIVSFFLLSLLPA